MLFEHHTVEIQLKRRYMCGHSRCQTQTCRQSMAIQAMTIHIQILKLSDQNMFRPWGNFESFIQEKRKFYISELMESTAESTDCCSE